MGILWNHTLHLHIKCIVFTNILCCLLFYFTESHIGVAQRLNGEIPNSVILDQVLISNSISTTE